MYRRASGDPPEKDMGAEKVKNRRSPPAVETGDLIGRETSSSSTSSTAWPDEIAPDGGGLGVNSRSDAAGAIPADDKSRRKDADPLGT